MRKTVSIIIAGILVLSVLSGCACSASEDTVLPVHVEGSIFGGNVGDSIGLELRFNPHWITGGDNTAYNADLAAFAALLSADTYFRTKDLEKGKQNRVLVDGQDPEAYDPTVLLSTLGFEDVRQYESFREGTYPDDPNDSVTMTIGYRNVQNRYDCFVIALRGCFSAGEWYSTFDIGSPVTEYSELTGEHPEWTDKLLMKGFSVAANRAMEFTEGYISSHDDSARENCVLVTGHSRGGSIAQILGARFEDDPGIKSFTYTFNAAPVTQNADAEKNQTVFNIFDSADFFTDCFCFGSEMFYRYGRTMSPAISERSDVRDAIAKAKGTDDYRCVQEESAAQYRELFGNLFPTRGSLYEQQSIMREFPDEADARTEMEKYQELAGAEKGLALGSLCFVDDVQFNLQGTYSVETKYCRAAFLQCIGRVLAYGESAVEPAKVLFNEESELLDMMNWLLSNMEDISAGHRLLNSYVLSGFVS